MHAGQGNKYGYGCYVVVVLLCAMPALSSLVPVPTPPAQQDQPAAVAAATPSPPSKVHASDERARLPAFSGDSDILKDVVRFLADEMEAPEPAPPPKQAPSSGSTFDDLADTIPGFGGDAADDEDAPDGFQDFGSTLVREAVDLSAAEEHAEGADQAKKLESVLHWAISHSDPGELSELAERVRRGEQLSAAELMAQKRGKVKELLDFVKSRPTEAALITEALQVLNSTESSEDEVLAALEALQELVEPLDNANDLRTLGGIPPLATLASAAEAERRPAVAAAAAYVLGTAASNNVVFQQHLLEDAPDIFPRLLALAASSHPEVAVKGLYAVASLVRNLEAARQAFHTAGGLGTVAAVLGNRAATPRVHRKAVNLMVDLLQMDPALLASSRAEGASLAAAAVQLLAEEDVDLQEKAVAALRMLLMGPQRRAYAGVVVGAGGRDALASLHASLAEAALEDLYTAHVRAAVGEVLAVLDTLAHSDEL